MPDLCPRGHWFVSNLWPGGVFLSKTIYYLQKVLSEGVQVKPEFFLFLFFGGGGGGGGILVRIQIIPLKEGHHLPVSEMPF